MAVIYRLKYLELNLTYKETKNSGPSITGV